MKNNLLKLIAVFLLFLSQTTHSQSIPSYVPQNGLVGWWPFNGNANDESGNGNNGMVNGTTLTADRFGNTGKAYSFDSIDFIEVLHNESLNLPNGTINLWFKTFSNKRMTLFNKSNFNNAQNENYSSSLGYLFNNGNTGIAYFSKYNSNCLPGLGWQGPSNTLNYADNKYHMLTCITSSKNIDIYIDGVKKASSDAPNILADRCQSSNLRFGINWSGDLSPFLGDMDDIAIWNRALSEQEIKNLYNANICYQSVTVTDTLLINMNIMGFNPITYQNTIKIYPNPTQGNLTIDFGNISFLSGYQMKITNSVGQQIFQTNISQKISNVNLSSFTTKGIYYVQLIDSKGTIAETKKIVMQ